MKAFLVSLNIFQSGVIVGLCYRLKAYQGFFKKCQEFIEKVP